MRPLPCRLEVRAARVCGAVWREAGWARPGGPRGPDLPAALLRVSRRLGHRLAAEEVEREGAEEGGDAVLAQEVQLDELRHRA